MSRLKDFCGPASWWMECLTCGGSGEVLCPHCNQDMDCSECSGKGGHFSQGSGERHGIFAGRSFDRNLLACGLEILELPENAKGNIRFWSNPHLFGLFIKGDKFFILLAGIRNCDKDAPSFNFEVASA